MSVKLARLLVALGLSIVCLLRGTVPASATVHTAHGEMEFGRITLMTSFPGVWHYDVPDSGVSECGKSIQSRAQFDDVAGTVDITSWTLDLPFVLPPVFGGTYHAEATAVERTTGTWSPITGLFSGVQERIDFQIRTFNTAGCIKGTVVCRGTLEMEFSGTTLFGGEGPIPGPTGPMWLEAATIEPITTTTCSGIWSYLFFNESVRIGANPFFGGPGAEYR